MSFAHSQPNRVRLERDDISATYELRISAPLSGSYSDPANLSQQLVEDGLLPRDIVSTFRQPAEQTPEIEKIILKSTGKGYTLAVLVNTLDENTIQDMYLLLHQPRERFGPHYPTLYVLGPDQSNNPQLNASNVLILYSKNG